MRANTRYLLWVLVPLVVLYVPPFLLVRSARMASYDPSIYGSMMEFGWETAGRDDDVVIFGDSAALYGVNPAQMRAETGLKVVNLPDTIGSLTVVNDLMLRHYLAHNRAPKLIVFYFTAWDLDYSHDEREGFLFEGEEVLVRHGTWGERWGFVRAHPWEAFAFPWRYYGAMARGKFDQGARRAHDVEVRAESGHLSHDARGPALGAGCELPDYLARVDGERTVRELAARYRTGGTEVLVYLAPLPACAGLGPVLGREYAGVGAAGPRVLPVDWFEADDSFAHLEPRAVAEVTRELEGAVREKLSGVH